MDDVGHGRRRRRPPAGSAHATAVRLSYVRLDYGGGGHDGNEHHQRIVRGAPQQYGRGADSELRRCGEQRPRHGDARLGLYDLGKRQFGDLRGRGERGVGLHPPLIDTVYGPYGPPDEPFENGIERITLALNTGSGYTVYTPNEAFIELGNVDLVFDLDVNENGSLVDPVDLTKNYLPGYEGNTAKVSTGTTFNVPTYQGQRM